MEFSSEIFEMIMLVCFGSSWPLAIMKTVQSKRVEGKSLPFLCCILIGYLAGITYKLADNFDYVIWFYVFNTMMVFTEVCLYLKYSNTFKKTGIRVTQA